MNLSETAFVALGWKQGEKLSSSDMRTIRWFTPTNEVPLCGHATVASAKVLATLIPPPTTEDPTQDVARTLTFESKVNGALGATINWTNGLISLNFPANVPKQLDLKGKVWGESMLKAILGPNSNPAEDVMDILYAERPKILMVRLQDGLTEEGLLKVKSDSARMLSIDTEGIVCDVIVTVKGSDEGKNGKPHFFSRFFAPWDGIDEDPVTGLAHTVLTPYWTAEYGNDCGQLIAKQHSKRGGDLKCTLIGDRVQITGNARVIIKGEIYNSLYAPKKKENKK